MAAELPRQATWQESPRGLSLRGRPPTYRIQRPVIVVEFDHQSGIVLDHDTRSRDHIHTVVRTPNGNDFCAGTTPGTTIPRRQPADRIGAG